MPDGPHTAEVLIVGAGMAGLAAASALRASGRDVLVIDKGRGVGGRMATRRIGEATFDLGAQFIMSRERRFAAAVEQWLLDEVVQTWYEGDGGLPDGQLRWRGRPSMTAIPKHLVRDARLLLERRLVSLRFAGSTWVGELEGGEAVSAEAVVLTPPVPQSMAVLDAARLVMSPSIRARLEGLEYERCLAVMAVLDGPSGVPPPGALAPADGPVAWIADNQMKGISAAPAITIHATPAFSADHWDEDRHTTGEELLFSARSWLGSAVTAFEVHGWRYAKPLDVDQRPCMVLNQSPPLVLAGDAFVAPTVEGAALSGWGAADAVSALRAARR